MIIFYTRGGLGNQMFQYAFIKSIAKTNEKIITCGFDDLLEVFGIEGITNITGRNKIIREIVSRIFSPILTFISSLRLITSIEVDYDDLNNVKKQLPRREGTTYTKKDGLLSHLRFIRLGYFQSEIFFNKKVIEYFKIKDEFNNRADDFMKEIPDGIHKVFVHIRRGDYKVFNILGKSTLLPIKYYKKQIEYFNNFYKNCFFIFLSDEPNFVEEEFNYIKNKKISRNTNPGTDFAIITKCPNGIVSNSTFSWWAAYMIKEKGIIFAPKYWLGFNSQVETPAGIFPSFAKEVEVEI